MAAPETTIIDSKRSRELYWRLLSCVRPYWRVFLIAIGGMVVLALTEPALASLMKPLMDGSFVDKDPETIRTVPLLLVGIYLLRGLSQYTASVGLAWVAQRLVTDLRQQIFARLLALPSPYFDRMPSGSLLSKVNFDVTQVAGAATNAIMVVVRDSLTIVGLLALMFYLNWQLSLLALLSAPAIAVIVKMISRRLRTSSRSLQQSMGDMTNVMQEGIAGQRVVKIFGGQAYENSRFHQESENVRHYNMKFIVAASLSTPVVQLVSVIAVAFIVYLASLQSADGHITIGGFSAFLAAMAMLFSPLKRLTSVNEHIQRGLAAAESVFTLIDEPIETDTGTDTIDECRGNIRFDHVTLVYPGDEEHEATTALHDISLDIQAGQTIAFVGGSGSGKTSLVNLLPRFYEATSGSISIDGHDIKTLKLSNLRQQIALVSQDVELFNDTVAANIAYGPLADVSREQIIDAAKGAYAMEFIESMPQKLDTLIGESGARLSGGQRQRIAIARAFLKNAPILILDEATSALDTQSEQQVQLALDKLKQGRTTLVIAHRLSTIENADRIVVMEQGRIVEVGDHAGLLAKGGAYARLYQGQVETG